MYHPLRYAPLKLAFKDRSFAGTTTVRLVHTRVHEAHTSLAFAQISRSFRAHNK